MEITGPDLDHLVTLGPYKALRYDRRKSLVLQRNEKSFRAGETPIKNVIFYFGLSARDSLKLFNNSKIDVIFNIPGADLDLFKDREEFVSTPLFEVKYLGH